MDSIQSSEEYDKLGMVLDSFESPVRFGEQQVRYPICVFHFCTIPGLDY